MTSTRAAARPTKTGTKVYIHTGCACSRLNGKVIAEVTTVDQAQAYAAEHGYATTFCKTSVVPTEPATPEEPVTAGPAPAPVKETAPAEAVEFSVEVNNRDQFGKQRRDAVAAIVAALGGESTHTAVKNRHKTGNDAFAVHVTGPAAWERTVREWLAATEAELVTVVANAKDEAKAMEGATANDRQKAWKRAAREFITSAGQRAAEELTGR